MIRQLAMQSAANPKPLLSYQEMMRVAVCRFEAAGARVVPFRFHPSRPADVCPKPLKARGMTW